MKPPGPPAGRRDFLALGGLAGAGAARLATLAATAYGVSVVLQPPDQLGADPHATAPDEIKNIPVLRTVVGGRTVHEA